MKFLFALFFSALSALPYNQIVIFGDSLSDIGNLYWADLEILPQSPPYYEGRFSNGPTWSDHVSEYFFSNHQITTQNYAVGGETTYFHNPFDGYLPYTLSDSRYDYYLHNIGKDKSQTLFIVWIGGNDYLNGSSDPEQMTSNVAKTIQSHIESLIDVGGLHFLVINLPDLSKIPYAMKCDDPQQFHLLSKLHNDKLTNSVAALQMAHPTITIQLFDMFSLFEHILSNVDQYNEKYQTILNDFTMPCWNGGLASVGSSKSPVHNEALRVSKNYDGMVSPCMNPDERAFWDHIHPNFAMHKIIGSILVKEIDQ